MSPFLIALLLQAPSAAEQAAAACLDLTRTDPAAAEKQADAWRLAGGGLPARQCLGLAYVAQGRYAPAAVAFEQAAREAEIARDAQAAAFWVQAGNASLAGDDPGKARIAFDRALALPTLPPAERGATLLDRARALVAVNDLPAARRDLDEAVRLVPDEPAAWLLSATLARRMKDGDRAARDIAEAEKRSPGDPAIAYEAGTIAAAAGRMEEARAAWTRAAAGGSEAAKAALAANPPG